MKSIKKLALLTLIAPMMAAVYSCDDAFEPAVENFKSEGQIKDMPSWAAGLLGHAYISNPLDQSAIGWSFTEVATDDAVSNDPNNNYLKMATGAWRADNNPLSNWQHLRASWQYINKIIELAPDVTWANDPVASKLYEMRFKGDAYGMRALYMYHLLMRNAGWTADGQLLGVPILLSSEDQNSEFNVPRKTFVECYEQIKADVEKCIELLPEDYGDLPKGQEVPKKYTDLGATRDVYDRVFGDHAKNRMNPKVARAVLAQAALLAASPAYSAGSGITWETAANLSGEVLKQLGSNPIAVIDTTGNAWYEASKTSLEKLVAGTNRKEFLWRSNKDESNDLEKDNYVPTLYGKGRINPSQNLVDAFPMANGYPITDERSNYDPQNPYANRDPRLDLYIIHNKSTYQGKEIITAADGTDDNALGKNTQTSTRTGYYLKKLLIPDLNCKSGSETKSYHIKPWMRYTEMFLNYAEAVNEAWGPTSKGNANVSPKEIIKVIRERAGIHVGEIDPYLEECAASKEKMRELIRNERRLELCFEGFRFWDLRRWKVDLTKLNETVKGMRIEGNTYTVFDVETRKYEPYMYYCPIPYNETVKYSNLVQNQGW